MYYDIFSYNYTQYAMCIGSSLDFLQLTVIDNVNC